MHTNSFSRSRISNVRNLLLAGTPIGYPNPLAEGGQYTINTIPEFLIALVRLIFLVATPLIVIFIIYAGFLFVTASGNEAQLTKARSTIIWTIVGAAVMLGALAISEAVCTTVVDLGSGQNYCSIFAD